MVGHLQEEHAAALKTEQLVGERIKEGVDSPLMQNKAHLSTARLRLRLAEAQGAIDVIRNRLSHLTGLPAASIETESESMPALPEVKQEDDLAGQAVQSSPARAGCGKPRHRREFPGPRRASRHVAVGGLRGAVWSAGRATTITRNSFNTAASSATTPPSEWSYNFPFFSPTQRARAEAADATALKAKKDAEAAKNQVSEETLRLQRSVEQMAAAKEVADLEYQVAQSDLESLQVRLDAGKRRLARRSGCARADQASVTILYRTRTFELERARITLLRATGELESWIGVGK